MTGRNGKWARWVLLAVLAGPVSGCVAAAAAAAGAGTGIYLTSRGVASVVNGSVDDAAARTRSAMDAEGITITETKTEAEGDKRSFAGKKDDLDITVELERQSPTTTKAEVTARKNVAEWDKDYARKLLDRIVKGG
ncbi:MAG: DUF3568 family protein [Gemmatimonadota bacterium]|jgi:hypothetical protein